ncbi:glycosyltransferase [Methylococcus sp. ANG]|uniref:glycosyltransferase family 4 protein n=1 Tax=unclassified Methylococcus TaxID=2618889 RepID=UPI001C52AD39|nr:glycosyltransferase [Methylococcus sp. Mc7]QXP83979.1 glycosyltransferase [Methylococcus sp. Mc7]
MENFGRLLLSAYQCAPGMGSVSQIGWEWYSRLAGRLPLTLVTHVRNRKALEAAGAPLPGTDVVYVDTEWFAGPLYRLASRLFPRSEHPVFLISSLDFFVYDRTALRMLLRLREEGKNWDLVHQPTPVSPLAATTLHRLGAPLILGPWNGGLKSPTNFPEIMAAESGWLYPVRRLGRLADRLLGSGRNARLILTANAATRADVPSRYRGKCRDMLENGVDLEVFRAAPWPESPGNGRPLRILFVGRLLPFKGVAMLLEAVARVCAGSPVHLAVAGAGPEENALRQRAGELGITGHVEFLGPLPHAEVARRLAESHVFCLPSIRESGGAVLLEAMAAARPVVALDYGGPSEIVDGEVGALVPATGWKPVVEGLAGIFEDVFRDPEGWRRRGQAGRQRVEQRYSWPAKIDAALSLYRECLESR